MILRIAAALAVCWLVVVLFIQGAEERAAETPDHMRMVTIFVFAVLLGLAGGVIVALYLLPAIGEKVGGLFFNPDQEVEKDVHAGAMARIAQGDYEGAVEEYRAVYEADPEDTLSLSEMARLYCEKLGDPESGARVLEEALEKEWPAEDGAFLAARLVDVRWNYQHDVEASRALLVTIAQTMPDTKHAANAHHRLREIDRVAGSEGSPLPALELSHPDTAADLADDEKLGQQQ